MKRDIYELTAATQDDLELLIKYKLNSILNYDEDNTKIISYVKENMPKKINNYQIVRIDEKKVGCVAIEKYEDGILLDEIYIDENYRNRGLGTDIISKILNDNAKVYLWVYRDNVKAINLYERLGFKIKTTLDKRILMERDDQKR